MELLTFTIIAITSSIIITILFMYLDSIIFGLDKSIWCYVKNIILVGGLVGGTIYLQNYLGINPVSFVEKASEVISDSVSK
jgi:hypothetical protein